MKPAAAAVRPIEVLFVEDNPGDGKLIQDALENSSHRTRVTVARTAASALALLRKENLHHVLFSYDFILLDIGLPDKSGWEVLSTLKSDPFLKDIPVLILTGSRDEHELMKAQFSTAEDFLQKPSDLSHLDALVDYLEENWFKKKTAGN